EAGGGHGGQRGGPGVELQNAGSQLNPFRAGRQVSERADRVERIRLGGKDDVQPGAVEVGPFRGHLLETAPGGDTQADTHGPAPAVAANSRASCWIRSNWAPIASDSAVPPDSGRTITMKSSIRPSSLKCRKSHPVIFFPDTVVSNTNAWSRPLLSAISRT